MIINKLTHNLFQIIPFDKSYNIKAFDCGDSDLNRYLTDYASQDIKRYIASIFICVSASDKKLLVGYYTLSSNYIDVSELNNEFTKRLPHYPYLPAILLGRLAVDKNFHKQRIGEYILMDALHRTFKSEIAAFAVIVEAKNMAAVDFYKHYGFIQFLNIPSKLFLPMKTIGKLFT